MTFAPIHIISGYNFLKSGLTVSKIVSSIQENNYFGGAITDEGSLFSLPSFVNAMEAIKKPFIAGMSFEISNDYLVVYATDEASYKTLIKLSTLYQKKELTYDSFKNHAGLIGVIETKKGNFFDFFNQMIDEDNKFNHALNKIAKMFDSFYLGIEVTSKAEASYANKVRKFAFAHSYDCVAFPSIRYQAKDDAIVLTMEEAIANGEKIVEKKLAGQEYFMSEANYQKIYNKQELANTIKIVSASKFNFHEKRGEILSFTNGGDSKGLLKSLVIKGLGEKGLTLDARYLERINYELEVINSMGFADYFLIVQDYVNYAKSQGIVVGPGRGSAAGCLVAYLLGIHEIDPIKYDLQFERFLNKGRKTLPDIDIDFMDTRRDEMVEYMRKKYGNDHVSSIATVQCILAKQSLRDVGRIYDYHDWLVSNLSKAIPITKDDEEENKKITLRSCYKKFPAFKALVDSDPYYLEIVTMASKLEKLPRQTGIHPAGVILSAKSIEESLPVFFDINDGYVSQYEAEYIEEQGFLKMDFLALRNLTIIDRCLSLIQQNQGISMKCEDIPYDSPETYELISQGKTLGVFQLEQPGMRRATKIIKPTKFIEVVDLLSLYRPGPMGSIKTYAECKEGKRKPVYVSEKLKDVLAPTYGIIVYQEQVNSIAKVMAGFSLSEADMFRRAISKKNAKILKNMEDKFIQGSINNGYSQAEAKRVYDAIAKFANYGFNKSHGCAYAVTACRMAYLKSHYPIEFYAAIMQIGASSGDAKFAEYVIEMRARGLNIVQPNINESDKTYKIKGNNLLFPLTEIHGANINLVNEILHERDINGVFKDYFDFVRRMYPYSLSEKNLEALINSGALDTLYPSRSSMKASIHRAMQFAEVNYSEDGQLSLSDTFIQAPSMLEAEDNKQENLELEFDSLGILLADNPLNYKKEQLDKLGVISICDLDEEDYSKVTVAAIIRSKKIINTKKGTPMAFIKAYDQSGELELTLFSDAYSQAATYLDKNNIVIIKGGFRSGKDGASFIADEVKLLEDK